MKTKMRTVAVVLVSMAMLFHLTGCSTALIAATAVAAGGAAAYEANSIWGSGAVDGVLDYAGQEAAILGLQRLGAAGAPVANVMIPACDDLTVYLNSGSLPTADIVNQIITGKFAGLDPIIVASLQAVAGTLGHYVPSASVVLTPQEIHYLVVFIGGIKTGAQNFLKNGAPKFKAKYSTAKYQKKSDAKCVEKADGYAAWFYASPAK